MPLPSIILLLDTRPSQGHQIKADVVLACTGQRPNTHFVPPEMLDPQTKLIPVTDTLQTRDHPFIFAVGDVNNAKGPIDGQSKTGYLAFMQAEVVAESLLAIVASGGLAGAKLKPWEPMTAAIMALSVGPKQGVLQLPAFCCGSNVIGPKSCGPMACLFGVGLGFWHTLKSFDLGVTLSERERERARLFIVGPPPYSTMPRPRAAPVPPHVL